MRRTWLAVAVIGVIVAAGACAAVEGLSDIQINDCALGGCEDASGDVKPDVHEAGPVDCGTPNTAQNCARCGTSCETQHSTGASCNGSRCSYSGCQPGWGDCDQDQTGQSINDNGCETQLNSTINCAGCGQVCDTNHSNGASCGIVDGGDAAGATSCLYTSCSPGYADCDPTPPDLKGCSTQLNSAANCGGCANACDTTTAVEGGVTCLQSTTCRYSCSPGLIDCNSDASLPDGAPSPNLDGCECHGSMCCADAGCAPAHSNGLVPAQNYYDCLPQGTYNAQTAVEACEAYYDAGCTTFPCGMLQPDGSFVTNGELVACPSSGPDCPCWAYGDSGAAGHVLDPHQPAPFNCYCPSSGDLQWF